MVVPLEVVKYCEDDDDGIIMCAVYRAVHVSLLGLLKAFT